MQTHISGTVHGHVSLAKDEEFDITGKTYSYSPDYTVRVESVRPRHSYGKPIVSVTGRRVLKSGKVGESMISLDVPADDERIPERVRVQMAYLTSHLAEMSDYIKRQSR
jgi:hypothetical protein